MKKDNIIDPLTANPAIVRRRPFSRIASAFEEFIHSQASSGILLLICTVVALVWANSRFGDAYAHIGATSLGLQWAGFTLVKSTQHWVNDGLMAVFFLLVGLEIKREILAGELRAFSTALLPIVAAIGGMVVPALIYLGFNYHHPQNMAGWAIPMATDIAFAIGVLAIMGKRIPTALLIFLAVIAIVDDLGAVLVIAIFYTNHLELSFLFTALGLFILLIVFNRLKIHRLSPYLIVGVILWFCLWKSGVHATISGVLVAMTIPGRFNCSAPSLSHKLTILMSKFDGLQEREMLENERRKNILQAIENLVHEVETPLQRLEHALHIPVNFVIIPIFVLLNAGVILTGIPFFETLHSSIALGIIGGLVIGKMVGVFGSCFVAGKIKPVKFPSNVGFKHIYPLSFIAGIGFTMSIFISELAFPNNPQLLNTAKIGILSGSLIAACLGVITMYLVTIKRS